MKPSTDRLIRPYQPSDRPLLRDICADTGFLGKPIDPAFEDRELFADYLTSYYTDIEPESTLVVLHHGEVKGYLMGCRHPKKKTAYEAKLLPKLVIKGLWRYFNRPYNEASRRYVHWLITNARKENPFTPPNIPHFHFNIRPEARDLASTVDLLDQFFAYLLENGDKQVYAQVVTYETRRSMRLFNRYSFEVIDEREVTKYRKLYDGKIHLFTILKDLTLSTHIYGADLREAEPSALNKLAQPGTK